MKSTLLSLIVLSLACAGARAQTSGSAPQDRPFQTTETTRIDLERASAPFTEMSRRAFPAARDRFLKGLPAGQTFYITKRLMQGDKYEDVYVRVSTIKDGLISGNIDSDLEMVTNFKKGELVECKESEIRDWTIATADGQEEGNFVGKFMDVYQDGVVPLIVKLEIGADGKVTSAKFLSAINRYQQDVTYCIPDAAKHDAEAIARKLKFDPQPKSATKYTHLIYRFQEKRVETPQEEAATKDQNPSPASAPSATP